MTLLPWLADALVLLGLAVMTVGVVGIWRMPDVYTQLHATSKAVFLGVIAILVASAASGDSEIILRLVLIGACLLLTTPVSAHGVARAAYRRREPMLTPDAIDESGRGLTPADREERARAIPRSRGERRELGVGYDGSEPSQRALERAAQLVAEDGRITLVTAGAILPLAPGAGTGDVDALGERRRVLAEGRSRLAELGIDADIVEAVGDPTDAIVETARDLDADLIVVGTRGRNIAARVLLGSVSTKVVNEAPCDVLVVR
ncbi:MAG: monovalent cation/H(+) antiporter subunit G [Gaiellaceae bacterium]|nr:monovalent cation/H(+) antiporter subunit G [Gaiellaceae bacterium]